MSVQESTVLFSSTVGFSRSVYFKSGTILLSIVNLKEVSTQLHENGFQKMVKSFIVKPSNTVSENN